MNRNAVQVFLAVEKFKPCTTFENNMSNIDMKYQNYKQKSTSDGSVWQALCCSLAVTFMSIIHQSNDDPEGNGAETHLPIIVINHENITIVYDIYRRSLKSTRSFMSY